jgi:Uma2 family endonuclease
MATAPIPRFSEEEYLRMDRAAETKSEFVVGEVFAMAGGTFRHNLLAMNWGGSLRELLKGRECFVIDSDMRIRTQSTSSYVYADVSVVCGEPQFHGDATDILINPVVVIEVLSPSTEPFDRGKKFALYREIASLHDYLLVHTGEAHVEQYSRQEGSWLFREYKGLEASVPIESIGCTVSLRDVYAGVLGRPE